MKALRKATETEVNDYENFSPIYPLGYFVRVKCKFNERFSKNVMLPVEDLRGSSSRPDPVYEVIAPRGYIFASGTHTKLCHDLDDVKSWGAEDIEPCQPDCDCGHANHAPDEMLLNELTLEWCEKH